MHYFCFLKILFHLSKNKISEVWDKEILENLIEEFREEEARFNRGIVEHLDMAISIEGMIEPMKVSEMKDQ